MTDRPTEVDQSIKEGSVEWFAEQMLRLERANKRLLLGMFLLCATFLLSIASCAAGQAPGGGPAQVTERLKVVDVAGEVNADILIRPGVSPMVRLLGGRSQIFWEDNPSGLAPTIALRNERFARIGYICVTPGGGATVVIERDQWQVLDEDGEVVF